MPALKTFPGSGKLLLLFLTLTMATVLVYGRDLYSYFLSDDFVNLAWVRESYAHPGNLWSQFIGPWLGGPGGIKYYRPMIMALWLTEYSIWKENYFAFIFVNLIAFLASSVLVMLIAYEFQQAYCLNKINGKLLWLFPICSFACFALYPLHVEVIAWMSNDCVLFETFFSLLSIWCYLRWQRLGQLQTLITSNIALVFALLIKESAIVTPVFLTLLAMLTPAVSEKTGQATVKIFSPHRLRSVYCFWIIFGLYLLIRRLVLGEFTGGWPSNIMFYVHSPLQEISMSIYRTLVPLTCANSLNTVLVTVLWLGLVAVISISAIRTLQSTRQGASLAITLILWFLLALIPPYRFFSIGKNLLHAILAYPCTIPISIFWGLGIANLPRSFFSVLIAGVFFSLSAGEVCINNYAWLDAGAQVKQFVRQLQAAYNNIDDDPQVRIVGLPWEKNGAFVFLNGLESLTKKPFLSRDIQNCSFIDGRDKYFPVAFTKDLMIGGSGHHSGYTSGYTSGYKGITILRWNSEKRILQQVEVPVASSRGVNDSKGGNGINCFQTGFLKVKIASGSSAQFPALKLWFENEAVPSYNPWDACYSDQSLGNASKGVYVFPLRDLPNWTFGGTCNRVKIAGPKHVVVKIAECTPVPEIGLVPQQIVVAGGQKVTTIADSVQPPVKLCYDASKIPGASEAVCEIWKSGTPDHWNLYLFNTLTNKQIIGQFLFAPTSCGKDRFVLRIRCKNATGQWVGWWSDQICVGQKR